MYESAQPPPLAGAESSSQAPPLAGAELRAPPGRRDWLIVRRCLPVVQADALLSGADFAVHREAPPRGSVLAISKALLPDDSSPLCAAFLHGIDSTGHLLVVSATQGPGTDRLLVLQAGSAKASTLPEVPASLDLSLSMQECIGVVDIPSGGSGDEYAYMLAQVHPASTPPTVAPAPMVSATAPASSTPSLAPRSVRRLLTYLSCDKTWSVKDIRFCLPCYCNDIRFDTVVSIDCVIVFADLSCGMIILDPLEDVGETRFVEFPVLGSCKEGKKVCRMVSMKSCLMVSQDRLCLVRIDDSIGHAVLSLWVFDGIDWQPQHHVPFSEIWGTTSYQDAGLPANEIPSVGLVDPLDHNNIYLLSGSKLFVVNLSTKDTDDCIEFFSHLGPANAHHSSAELCCWTIPHSPSLTSTSTAQVIWRELKRKGGDLQTYAESTYGYLKRMGAKKVIGKLPDAADAAAAALACFFPGSATYVVPVTHIVKDVSNKAMKAINISEAVSRLRNSTPSVERQHIIVGTAEEAKQKLSTWSCEGESSGVSFGFPHDMSQARKDVLRQVFVMRGLEHLIWDPQDCVRGFDTCETE